MRKLITLLSIPVFVFGLGSCNQDDTQYVRKHKVIDGFTMIAFGNAVGNHFSMYKESNTQKAVRPTLIGSDLYGIDTKPDGRFDEMKLISVPKGDVLERYANLDSISKYFKEVIENGGY